MLLSAHDAARRLGIKPATLYAYVSRGLLRSAPGAEGRKRRYYAEDVARLERLRRTGRRAAAPPKPFDALLPVLDTSVSLIEDGRLYYRGVDAGSLSASADFETVAGLLWGEPTRARFAIAHLKPALRKLLARPRLPAAAIDRARVILVDLAMGDVGALEVAPQAVARTGARLVPALAAAVSGRMPAGRRVHEELAAVWRLGAAGADLVRRCLVLAADHELNASTYVGRCIASTGASPYAVVLGALGALSGPRHGGETAEVEGLLREVLRSGDVEQRIAARLRRGERIPGFGHPLYPDGDPRAAHILEAVASSRHSGEATAALRVGRDIAALIGRPPNVDFALGLTAVVLRLPPGSALGMFLVARSVGWIAHAIEQYAAHTLIRPRARYVGPLPVPAADGAADAAS
jgi:citrate synthase